MSYSSKYLIEAANNFGGQWKIDIQEDSWSGDVFTLTATGDPLHFEFDSDSDDFNEPSRPSKVTLNVISIADFSLSDFYSEQDLRLKVLIYLDTVLFWQGFIITGEYEEPYDQVPYPVKLTAIDGLNYLKEVLYADTVTISAGIETVTYYEGRQLESKIICDILGKIDITGFTEYVNVYETNMNDSTDDSPLYQALLDVDVFRDKMCWDVLQEICGSYNAAIRQRTDGTIGIYRPTELINATVYGRIFTAWNSYSSTSFAPAQDIKRIGVSSLLQQLPGSVMMIKRAAKKVTISQDYGYKQSFVTNWEIKGNSFTKSIGSVFDLQSWTKTHATLISPATSIGENDGVLIVLQNHYPTLDHVLYQSFGDNLKVTADVCFVEFDYMLYNSSGVARTGEVIYVELKSDNASKYLYGINDDSSAWDNSANRFAITADAPIGSTGWVTFKRQVPGIPTAGSYTIKLFAINDAYAGVSVGFRNIKFYGTSDEISQMTYPWAHWRKFHKFLFKTFTGIWTKDKFSYYDDNQEIVAKDYVLENAVKGTDINLQYLLGDVTDTNVDNVIEQFQGAKAVNTSPMIASALWNAGGSSAPLLEIVGGEIGLQYSRPKQLIQMNILAPDGLDILGNFQDSVNTLSGSNRKFVFNRGSLDAKQMIYEADLMEIIEETLTGYDYLCTSAGDELLTSLYERIIV